VGCPKSKVVLLEEGMIGGCRGNKCAWRRLVAGSTRRKARYGCNWRQHADDGRRMGRDDGHEVA